MRYDYPEYSIKACDFSKIAGAWLLLSIIISVYNMAYKFEVLKVLVVEDNVPMLDLTRSILQTFGVGTVIPATNGEIGFKKFCEENPDMVIADWMMQPCDGISLTRLIRNDPRSPNQYAPVILMTGFSEKRRVISARDAGVNEFLVKPFNARDLYRRIVQIIEKPRQFIRAENFFGPDRRRSANPNYLGPRRRAEDMLIGSSDNGKGKNIVYSPISNK